MQTLIKAAEVINGGIFRPAPLNARFDEMLISPNIIVAQVRFLLPLLCADMLADMISKMNAANSNYNPALGAIVQKFPTDANYEALWTEGGLMELCGRAVYYICLPYIANQTGSNGLFMESQNSDKSLKMLQDNELANIKALETAVTNYLCKNYTSYPLYPATEKCEDVIGCNDCIGQDTEQKNKGQKILSRFGIV